MVTLREGNVRGREQLGKNEYFFEVALGMLSYMQESFVLDSTQVMCPILAVPHNLYTGALLLALHARVYCTSSIVLSLL